jgi:hypothetical protein
MTAKGAKAKSRVREAGARKVARRDRSTVGKGAQRQRKAKVAGQTARLVKEVPMVEGEGGAAGAGNAKQIAWPGGVSGQGRERNAGPPPLPVPIATFTI